MVDESPPEATNDVPVGSEATPNGAIANGNDTDAPPQLSPETTTDAGKSSNGIKPLTLAILGGTGQTGKHALFGALERGHNVRALGRSKAKVEGLVQDKDEKIKARLTGIQMNGGFNGKDMVGPSFLADIAIDSHMDIG